jgi:dTDP-4-dehydrorhamnose 3,5-epimerase
MLGLNVPKFIEINRIEDGRGSFSQIWSDYQNVPIAQMNESISHICTFRGLHYQWDVPQGKIIRVTNGDAIFFELDIRTYSPEFGKHRMHTLSSTDDSWLWVPPGYANGFFALEEDTRVMYMCTSKWSSNEGSINYSVLDFGFEYYGGIRHISDKDKNAPNLDKSIQHLKEISERHFRACEGTIPIF